MYEALMAATQKQTSWHSRIDKEATPKVPSVAEELLAFDGFWWKKHKFY